MMSMMKTTPFRAPGVRALVASVVVVCAFLAGCFTGGLAFRKHGFSEESATVGSRPSLTYPQLMLHSSVAMRSSGSSAFSVASASAACEQQGLLPPELNKGALGIPDFLPLVQPAVLTIFGIDDEFGEPTDNSMRVLYDGLIGPAVSELVLAMDEVSLSSPGNAIIGNFASREIVASADSGRRRAFEAAGCSVLPLPHDDMVWSVVGFNIPLQRAQAISCALAPDGDIAMCFAVMKGCDGAKSVAITVSGGFMSCLMGSGGAAVAAGGISAALGLAIGTSTDFVSTGLSPSGAFQAEASIYMGGAATIHVSLPAHFFQSYHLSLSTEDMYTYFLR